MAADRGAYIDQSQSFNVHIAEPNFGKLTSMHFYAWKKVDNLFFDISFTDFLGTKNWNVLFAYKTSCQCYTVHC